MGFLVILNGKVVRANKRFSSAKKTVDKIRQCEKFNDENNLLEIYDKENGEFVWTNGLT